MNAVPTTPGLPSDAPQAFSAPWEAQIFALVVTLHERGLFGWSEFAMLLGEEIHAHPDDAHYHSWLRAATRLVLDKGIVDAAALESRALDVARYRQSDHHHSARTTPITVVAPISSARA